MGYQAYLVAKTSLRACSTLEQLNAWKTVYDQSLITSPDLYTATEKSMIETIYREQLASIDTTPSAPNPPVQVPQSGLSVVMDELKDYDGMTLKDVAANLTEEQYEALLNSPNPVQRKELLYKAHSLWEHSKAQEIAHKANPNVKSPYAINTWNTLKGAINKVVEQNHAKPPGEGQNVEDPKVKSKTSVTPPAESGDNILPMIGWGDIILITGGIVIIGFIIHAIISH